MKTQIHKLHNYKGITNFAFRVCVSTNIKLQPSWVWNSCDIVQLTVKKRLNFMKLHIDRKTKTIYKTF